MRRRRLAVPLLAALLAAAPVAAQPPAAASAAPVSAARLAAARRYMEVTRVRETAEEGLETTLRMQEQQIPAAAAMRERLRGIYKEVMSWESLEPEYARAFAETFTEDELRSLIAFYQTPTGRMLLERTPALTTRMQAIAMTRVQAMMPRIMEQLMGGMGGGGPAGTPPAAPPR